MPTKHVLVPLDGSVPAEAALENALTLARSVGADITLLGVVQPLGEVIKTRFRDVCVDNEWPNRVRRAASYLLSVAERPIWKGLPVRAAVEIGEVTETVTDYARSHAIDFNLWPPAPLGEAASRPKPQPDLLTAPQTSSTGLPSRPSRRVFEPCLINNETIEPWILEDSTEILTT